MSDRGSVPPGLERVLALTRDFYAWEQRGRGCQVWPEPVELEPPFRPYSIRQAQQTCIPIDDGRRQTLLSRALDSFLGRRVSPPAPPESLEIQEPVPERALDIGDFVEIQVSLPQDAKVTPGQAESFLLGLSACLGSVAFEVIANEREIVVQISCGAVDSVSVRHQLQACFPEAALRETTGYLSQQLNPKSETYAAPVDFGLSSECMCPLRVPDKWSEVDPFTSLAATFSTLEHGESAVFQILFSPTRAPWAANLVRAVTTWEGDSFFADAPEMVKQAEEKTARPLYAVVCRAAAVTSSEHRTRSILRGVAGALSQFADPAGNSLIPLEDDDYPAEEHLEHIVHRVSRRSGMLLNVSELAALAHPPSSSVFVARLRRVDGRTRLAPAHLEGHQLVLGESRYFGQTRVVSLPPEIRRRHMHVIGATGTGKSTLLLNLIVQDMENGNGLAVFDPHGDLIEDILHRVPESRINDVVLIDPSDTEYVVGVNVLHAHSDLEKTLIASDMVAVFKRLSTAWGDQMTAVLGNAVLAVLESERGGTLADLRRFLIDKDFRTSFLPSVKDLEVQEYWRVEFPLIAGRPHGSVLARLGSFLRPKPIRAMVSAREKTLDLSAVMNDGRIFLAKLSQGLIGEENSSLLGALFVGKFQQLALARQATEAQNRRPFMIYLDEFQNFAVPSLTTLLSGGRKYGVGLVLAHQEMRQVAAQNPELLSAVMANAATRIAFRMGDEDAKRLEDGFANFEARDLQNLGVGEAVGRVERADADFSLLTSPARPTGSGSLSVRSRVVSMSLEHYAQRIPEGAAQTDQTHEETPPADVAPSNSTAPTQAAVAAVQRQRSAPLAPPPPSLSTPGRGGAQHKYLQELIKRWGEANGWRVSIEKSVLDGLGSVDVALDREGISVACEIGISSANHHEMQNIQKCLAAGFQLVVAVVLDAKRLKGMTTAAAELGEYASRVVVSTPDELFAVLHGLQTAPSIPTQSVRGYPVKVKKPQTPLTVGGSARVAETILTALQRLRGR